MEKMERSKWTNENYLIDKVNELIKEINRLKSTTDTLLESVNEPSKLLEDINEG